MTLSILRDAWNVFWKNFGLIALVVLVIWLPLNLISCLVDHYVFDPEDIRRSFKFSQFLENFIGIIATGTVISIGYSSLLGRAVGFNSSLSEGMGAWGRMFWTRLLSGICVVIGLLCCVLPGLYLLYKLALVEQVAVCERVSGEAAMRRSFALTKGRFGELFPLGMLICFGGGIIAVMAVLPNFYIEDFDSIIYELVTGLIADLYGAFGVVLLCSAYVKFVDAEKLADGDGDQGEDDGLKVEGAVPPMG